MALQRKEWLGRFQTVVFIEQVFECNTCVVVVLYLLYNLAERVAGYRVAVSLQFICKAYIGSVNMPAYFEIDYPIYIL